MTVIESTQCVFLDTQVYNQIIDTTNITSVSIVPAGAAINATLNNGLIPVYQNATLLTKNVDWYQECCWYNANSFLVIALPEAYAKGTVVSFEIVYNTANHRG